MKVAKDGIFGSDTLTADGQLGSLAKQRAAAIKEYSVKKHRMEDDRLLVCLPEYDVREAAIPRVVGLNYCSNN